MPARHHFQSLLRSLVAAGLGVLVLSLGLLTHLPAAHAWLHAAEHTCEPGENAPASPAPAHSKSALPAASAGHACAITIFAQGTDAPTPAPLLAPPPLLPLARLSLSENAPCLRIPSGLLPPGRAPPAAA